MNRINELEKIIDSYMYKDIANIIKSYLFFYCKDCNKKMIEQNTYEAVNNEVYCVTCSYKPHIHYCSKCLKLYSILENNLFCCICLRGCCIYCSICFMDNKNKIYQYETDNEHNRFYFLTLPDIDLIGDVLDI